MGLGAAIAIALSALAAALVISGFVWAARADGREQEAYERGSRPRRFPVARRPAAQPRAGGRESARRSGRSPAARRRP